ncbi:MAG: hypothetical protein ACI841_003051, partial [Planctomycetota bacterium]
GSDEFVAVRRDEVLLFFTGGAFGTSEQVYYREDETQVADFVPLGGAWLDSEYDPNFGFSALSVSRGDLDGDGRPEPICVGIDRGEVDTDPYVRIGQPDRVGGNLGMDNCVSLSLGVNPHPQDLLRMSVDAADLDGDGLDEMIVSEYWSELMTARLRVFQLANLGGSPALELLHDQFFGVEGLWVASGQFDDDEADELLITSWIGGMAVVDIHDDLASGLALMGGWGPFDKPTYAPLVGQFDDDPYSEVILEAAVGFVAPDQSSHEFEYWDGQAAFPSYVMAGAVSSIAYAPMVDALDTGFVSADRDRDGRKEVLWVTNIKEASGYTELVLSSWEPVTGERKDYSLATGEPFEAYPAMATDLCVIDDSASGHDKVLVAYANRLSLPESARLFSVEFDAIRKGQPGATLPSFVDLDISGSNIGIMPLLVAGDFDDDGLRLQWTGIKHRELPSPIPMVLLAAPPTKAGILQNYDNTGSSYSVSTTTEQALELSMGASLSLAVGFEVEDLFGLFGVESTLTIEAAYEKTLGLGSSITTTNTFSGSHDRNSIVFAGVLQQVYDYEVLAAPNADAIGTIMTLNVPVESRIYKWSLDFYAQNVAGGNMISPYVLGHTIGDPTSYPTEAGLKGLLTSAGGPFAGWSGSKTTVGEGTASNGVGLEIASVTSVGDTVSFSVEASSQLKAGGVTVGATVAVFGGVTYTVTTSKSASFEGEIGDIDGADWNDWFYDVGLVVYTREVPDELPYQVVQFWTDPLGVGYP